MLCLWLLVGLVQGSLGGGLYPVSSVEAHGPLARLALQPHYGHGDVTSLHQVPPVSHVPVTQYVAQPAHVYQLPSAAQVPVLKYTSQSQYVQRLVDVANTRVAVAKLQVKRPAIQKQFYDIEERTIVRPVGSALLELDEPVSKQFVSPFSTVSAGHHTIAQFHRRLLYPVGSYPLVSYGHVPLQYYPSAPIQQTPQSPQQYPFISQPLQHIPSTSELPQQAPINPQFPQQPANTDPRPPQPTPTIPQFPQQPANMDPRPPQQAPTIPQFPQQPANTDPRPPQPTPTIPQFPQQTINTDPRPPQQFQFGSQPSPDESFNAEFDSSDSIVVDNPDFTRLSKSSEESQKDNKDEVSFEEFESEVLKDLNENKDQERVVQNIINDFENLQLLRMFSSQTSSEKPLQRSQLQPNFNVLLEPPRIQEQPQSIQDKPSESFKPSQRSNIASDDRQVSAQTESDSIETSQKSSYSTTERELPTLFRSFLNHLQDHQITAAKSSAAGEVISSARNLSQEELLENQRKLLELLTGRGEVSEVALPRAGESVVRGRVVSVTPAPCAEGEERVNTRRVVVSRPVHTVQEVDVQRPFTQLERVAVHEPVHAHIATLTPLHYH